MKITEERMKELLPPNILESELSLASQKVLAALIDWYRNSQAFVTKEIFIDNSKLAKIAGVGGNSLQEAFRQLYNYRLVDRIKGTSSGNASQYIIHFNRLIKPLKRMTFEEMFAEELEEEAEPSEKPISTTVHNSISQVSLEENISEKGILVKGISDKGSLGKGISVEGSQDKSSTDEIISEEDIPEETGSERQESDTSDIILNNKSNTNNELYNKYTSVFNDNIPGNGNNFNEKENKENLEREFERELTEPNSIPLNEGKENSIDTSSNQKSMERDPSTYDLGDSERKSKDEIGAEEPRHGYQSMNKKSTEANQDSVQDDVQEETGGESSSNPSQSNGEDAGQMQDAYTSSTNQSPLDEAVTGTQMVRLFDSDPLQENQKTPQLSVRAATRKWAEELETRYQGREETLRYLAIYDPWDFEKYVNYLKLQQRPAFMRHLELISSLASSLGIDVDLDL